jgi:hypothetical protein
MVETITPVVHGGRRSRWALVLGMHVAGAAAAAAAFGALLGAAGAMLDAPWGGAGLSLVGVLATLYLAREILGLPVPVPQLRRQVPDWWRTFFPFGPASFLYGVGLGVGFLTYLTHGTLVVVAAAAVASGRPSVGAALMGAFGLARGLGAIVALRARTPDESSELVGRLAVVGSWSGWRLVHAAALSAVVVLTAAALGRIEGAAEPGALAAAIVTVAFGAAAISKLLRARAWRRALTSYRLPAPIERVTAAGVPLIELGIAALPLLGVASTAGLLALVALAAFSAAVVLARVRVGRRIDCGCFGTTATRDYRALLARNAVLAVVASVAWLDGIDAPPGGLPAWPSSRDALPAALVVFGLGLVLWVGVQALLTVRRGASR